MRGRLGRTILLVDDDPTTKRILDQVLNVHEWKLVWAHDTSEALKLLHELPVSIVLLESIQARPDVYELVSHISATSRVPVIFVSRRTTELDKLKAFASGADDYVTKPFGWKELAARMSAAIRRSEMLSLNGSQVSPEQYAFGDLEINVDARTVTIGGDPIYLTQTEFRLLLLFVRNTGKVLPHNFILTAIWGEDYADDREYVRAYVYRLRRKLERGESTPPLFISISGVGYLFTGDTTRPT